MIQNYIIIFGIIELLVFLTGIYLIIRANIFVNTLQNEVNELHLYLPQAIREIRLDLKSFNNNLAQQISKSPDSAQKLGFIAGKILTEMLLFRFKAARIGKKFIILSFILKTLNIKKILKPISLIQSVR